APRRGRSALPRPVPGPSTGRRTSRTRSGAARDTRAAPRERARRARTPPAGRAAGTVASSRLHRGDLPFCVHRSFLLDDDGVAVEETLEELLVRFQALDVLPLAADAVAHFPECRQTSLGALVDEDEMRTVARFQRALPFAEGQFTQLRREPFSELLDHVARRHPVELMVEQEGIAQGREIGPGARLFQPREQLRGIARQAVPPAFRVQIHVAEGEAALDT